MAGLSDDIVGRVTDVAENNLPGAVIGTSLHWKRWTEGKDPQANRFGPGTPRKLRHKRRPGNFSFDFHFRSPKRKTVSCGLFWTTRSDTFDIRFELIEEDGQDIGWIGSIWKRALPAFSQLESEFPGAGPGKETFSDETHRYFCLPIDGLSSENLTAEKCRDLGVVLARFIDTIGETILPLREFQRQLTTRCS